MDRQTQLPVATCRDGLPKYCSYPSNTSKEPGPAILEIAHAAPNTPQRGAALAPKRTRMCLRLVPHGVSARSSIAPRGTSTLLFDRFGTAVTCLPGAATDTAVLRRPLLLSLPIARQPCPPSAHLILTQSGPSHPRTSACSPRRRSARRPSSQMAPLLRLAPS